MDTLGLILVVVVHAANIQDRDGAKLAFEKLRGRFHRLRVIWADGGYAGKLVDWVKAIFAGHWRLLNALMTSLVSSCYPSVGLSNVPLAGLVVTED